MDETNEARRRRRWPSLSSRARQRPDEDRIYEQRNNPHGRDSHSQPRRRRYYPTNSSPTERRSRRCKEHFESNDATARHEHASERARERQSAYFLVSSQQKPESGRSKRNRRRKRQRSASSSSPNHPNPNHAHPNLADPRRNGVVSVDYHEKTNLAKWNTSPRKRRRVAASESDSSHDDTTDHYKGDPGSMIGEHYQVIKEVGMGTFGRVLDCLDLRRRDYVAVKVVRAVKRYYESALIEARIVQDINRRGGRGLSHFVRLFDSFTFRGHYCIVFESLGPSLYDFLKQHDYKPFPMIVVQDITVQLLQALEFLHGFRMIHADLKIENILLMNDRETLYHGQRVPESTRIKLIDFGSACYDDEKRSSVINTRQYRAPEVILGTGWSMPSDMWCAGCILVELYKGELLFATHDSCEHLALMDHIIGPFPLPLVRHALASSKESIVPKVFDSHGKMRSLDSVLSNSSASYVRRAETLASIVRHSSDSWFLDLLRRMLVIDPEERATAHESLQYLSRMRRNFVRCA